MLRTETKLLYHVHVFAYHIVKDESWFNYNYTTPQTPYKFVCTCTYACRVGDNGDI